MSETQSKPMPNVVAHEGDGVSGVAQPPVDGFGAFGLWLTRYHAGDVMGFVGLMVSILTAALAQSARKAAKKALARRDVLEVSTLLSDLAAHLREVRNLLSADDWSGVSDRIDIAVNISNRISTTAVSSEENQLLDGVRVQLRSIQKAIAGIKGAAKHAVKRHKQITAVIDLIDSVEQAQTNRLKNDNLP